MGIVYGGSQIVINLTVINRIFLVSILSIDGLCCYQNTQAAKTQKHKSNAIVRFFNISYYRPSPIFNMYLA